MPAGTVTRSQEYDEATETYRPVTYTLAADIKLPEEYAIENEWRQWRGESSIYTIYPPSEVLKNPYLVRKSERLEFEIKFNNNPGKKQVNLDFLPGFFVFF